MFQLCRQPVTMDQDDLPFGLSCGVCVLGTTACLISQSLMNRCVLVVGIGMHLPRVIVCITTFVFPHACPYSMWSEFLAIVNSE